MGKTRKMSEEEFEALCQGGDIDGFLTKTEMAHLLELRQTLPQAV